MVLPRWTYNRNSTPWAQSKGRSAPRSSPLTTTHVHISHKQISITETFKSIFIIARKKFTKLTAYDTS